MIRRADLIIENVARHRNGTSGDPFHVVTFLCYGREMVAIQFQDNLKATAVFDRRLLAAGEIAFAENSFRGDCFADAIREAIAEFNDFENVYFGTRHEH